MIRGTRTLPICRWIVLLLLFVPSFSWCPPQQRIRTNAFHTAAAAANNNNNNNDDDEAEWKAIYAAFRLYKAAFGDLKVPQRFVVPNMKPWPKAAHELKLGKVVAEMRATGKYLTPERRQALEQLGFVWQLRSKEPQQVSWQQVQLAYQTYHTIYGNEDDIPNTFTVPAQEPWPQEAQGMPLGRFWPVVRDTVLPQNVKARRAFEQLGYSLEKSNTNHDDTDKETVKTDSPKRSTQTNTKNPIAVTAPAGSNNSSSEDSQTATTNDARFQIVYAALQTYKAIHGDLLVPQPFTIPSDDDTWPEQTWGLRLGARVNAIRSQGSFVNNNPERRQMLDQLGFAWNPPPRNGRSRATRRDDEDEEAVVMMQGSFDLEDMSSTDDDASSVMASNWNLDGARLPDSSPAAAAAAMAAAKSNTPGTFSADEEYVEERSLEQSLKEATDRALDCGVIEGLTSNKRVIKGKQTKDIPWFNDDFGEDFVFEDVVEALTVYKAMYGNLRFETEVNENDEEELFVVPTPKELTGFLDMDEEDDFGDGMDAFDQFDLDARAAAAMASFGDEGSRNGMFRDNSGEDVIDAEIRRLEQEVEQTSSRTATATAPMSVKPVDSWPEHLAGMQLGSIVQRIRDGSLEVKHLPERKAQLDALGFDWGDEKYFIDVPFEKAMCAMYAYYMIRGDLFVYEDFVMPDEDPWPEALAGYELGQAVKRLRQLQNFLEAYHSEKVSLLRMIDFVWFSDTMALPLDPNEQAMTSETLLLSAFGHPDYAKMVDIPMGLPDKIMADGPFMETNDDPKLWWRQYHNWEYVKDYWYQQGRRDNAFALRNMGYPQMADEHEAKYGPGLFSKISATMQDLTDNGIESRSVEEKQELLKTLSYYRQEMLGCTDIHPQDRDQMLFDFDSHMLEIMKDKSVVVPLEEIEEDDSSAEYEDEYDDEYEDEELEEDDEEEYEEDEEFVVEDELGLGDQ